MEADIARRINDIRRRHRLSPLRVSATLSGVARQHSARMGREGFFSHNDPSGRAPADRLRAAGLSYSWVGENIAMSYNVTDPVATAVEDWMASRGHRANILRREYTQTGVGVWRSGRTYYITQVFMRPRQRAPARH